MTIFDNPQTYGPIRIYVGLAIHRPESIIAAEMAARGPPTLCPRVIDPPHLHDRS